MEPLLDVAPLRGPYAPCDACILGGVAVGLDGVLGDRHSLKLTVSETPHIVSVLAFDLLSQELLRECGQGVFGGATLVGIELGSALTNVDEAAVNHGVSDAPGIVGVPHQLGIEARLNEDCEIVGDVVSHDH